MHVYAAKANFLKLKIKNSARAELFILTAQSSSFLDF